MRGGFAKRTATNEDERKRSAGQVCHFCRPHASEFITRLKLAVSMFTGYVPYLPLSPLNLSHFSKAVAICSTHNPHFTLLYRWPLPHDVSDDALSLHSGCFAAGLCIRVMFGELLRICLDVAGPNFDSTKVFEDATGRRQRRVRSCHSPA